MNKEQQRALLKVVFYMAGMIMYQGNIFGTYDTKELSKLVTDLFKVFPEE